MFDRDSPRPIDQAIGWAKDAHEDYLEDGFREAARHVKLALLHLARARLLRTGGVNPARGRSYVRVA